MHAVKIKILFSIQILFVFVVMNGFPNLFIQLSVWTFAWLLPRSNWCWPSSIFLLGLWLLYDEAWRNLFFCFQTFYTFLEIININKKSLVSLRRSVSVACFQLALKNRFFSSPARSGCSLWNVLVNWFWWCVSNCD